MTIPRWFSYQKDAQITCFLRHHLPNVSDPDESGFIRCNKWIDAEKRECGRWVWICRIRGGGNIVTEVTLDEKLELKTLHSPAEKLYRLGFLDLASTAVVFSRKV